MTADQWAIYHAFRERFMEPLPGLDPRDVRIAVEAHPWSPWDAARVWVTAKIGEHVMTLRVIVAKHDVDYRWELARHAFRDWDRGTLEARQRAEAVEIHRRLKRWEDIHAMFRVDPGTRFDAIKNLRPL